MSAGIPESHEFTHDGVSVNVVQGDADCTGTSQPAEILKYPRHGCQQTDLEMKRAVFAVFVCRLYGVSCVTDRDLTEN